MHKIDDLSSILDAIHEINLKPKRKKFNYLASQAFTPKINKDSIIPFDVDKIIKEAEEYKQKSKFKPTQVDITLNKNKDTESRNYNKNLEDIQEQIIEDLYLKFKNKVKKNTLKTIFNLHLKIKDLEKKLENLKIKNINFQNTSKLILKNEVVESSKIQDKSIIDLDNVLSKNKNILKDEVVKSFKIQDSTINVLNEKKDIYKKTEEKLRLQIIDLEQNNTILLSTNKKLNEFKNNNSSLNNMRELLKSIYKQVEQQKIIFINLKKYSMKKEQDSFFFKENYEKLIVENNNVKKRLAIAKEQIVIFESNKLDLLSSIDQLNEILSKTNTTVKISPLILSEEEKISKKEKKI